MLKKHQVVSAIGRNVRGSMRNAQSTLQSSDYVITQSTHLIGPVCEECLNDLLAQGLSIPQRKQDLNTCHLTQNPEPPSPSSSTPSPNSQLQDPIGLKLQTQASAHAGYGWLAEHGSRSQPPEWHGTKKTAQLGSPELRGM